jgi:hypothetical protein
MKTDDARRCRRCKQPFWITERERVTYEQRTGEPWRPQLCRDCRIATRDDASHTHEHLSKRTDV